MLGVALVTVIRRSCNSLCIRSGYGAGIWSALSAILPDRPRGSRACSRWNCEGGGEGMIRNERSSHSDVGYDVLVEAEEVVGVIATLQRLEPVILLGPGSLADPLLTLLHQEVHIDACVVGLK